MAGQHASLNTGTQPCAARCNFYPRFSRVYLEEQLINQLAGRAAALGLQALVAGERRRDWGREREGGGESSSEQLSYQGRHGL